MSMFRDDYPVRELSEEECWERLMSEEFGRLAFLMVDELHLVPINYAVDGRSLLFRTAGGNKLFAVVLSHDVVFEIDHIDDEQSLAWSVIVRGYPRLLEEDEARRADLVPLRPWVDLPKESVVEIKATSVSGREFKLSRPWLDVPTA